MNEIKYLGVQGLEELITLAQNGLANKADVLQFDTMPNPIRYIGRVVQYVGAPDVSFTRSHFYYSNGTKWTDEQATHIEIVTALPSWVNADSQILYILKDTTDKKMGLYVKNPSVNDSWFTVESSGSFAVVATLPQWADADPSTIYFKADGNILTGYIKKTGTIGAWYTLGGASQDTVDTALSATSTNPVQNKAIYAAIQDIRAQVSSVYHYKGSCLAADLPVADNKVGDTWNLEDASSYGPQGINVAWDGTKWDALGGVEVETAELIRNLHDPDWSQAVSITATQLVEGYTVPKRGIFVGSIIPNTYDVTGSPIIKINDIAVSYARGSSNEISHGSVQCPVCANDIIRLEGLSKEHCDAHTSFVPYKAQ